MTYPAGTVLMHSHRGRGVFTEQCAYLQERNPDPSSVFVEFDGEILEVTKSRVRAATGEGEEQGK